MKCPGRFADHILPEKLNSISLSFLVESMIRLRGGIAPNIAYNLALLGGKARLFATVGEDFEDYRLWLDGHGIDTSLVRVVPGVNTASFFANTDRDNNQIASFYPGAMTFASELSLYDLDGKAPDLVVISPNEPLAMRRCVEECQQLFIPYFYDPSQQIVRMEGVDLQKGVEGAKALFVNEYEYSLIQKATGMSQKDILDHVSFLVVTLGEKGTSIYTGDDLIEIPVVPPAKIADPTGVGDAFRGGFLYGYSRGYDLGFCGRLGSLSATYCLEANGPQGHYYTANEYVARFREHFDDDGLLDELIKKWVSEEAGNSPLTP
jgi:adenosine kinase